MKNNLIPLVTLNREHVLYFKFHRQAFIDFSRLCEDFINSNNRLNPNEIFLSSVKLSLMTKFRVNDRLYYVGDLNKKKIKDIPMVVVEVLTSGSNATIKNPKYLCTWKDPKGTLTKGWFKENELEY